MIKIPTLFPMGDCFAIFGRSQEDHQAIADGLIHAELEQPQGEECRMGSVVADHDGVSISSDLPTEKPDVSRRVALQRLSPYLPHFEPVRVKRLAHRALMSLTSHGNRNFDFTAEEEALLDRLLPRIAANKLKAWQTRREPITFEIKVFGLGYYANEFPAVLGRFVKELERQSHEPLAVSAILNGFDCCSFTMGRCWEYLTSGVNAASRSSVHGVRTDLNLYYGDLADKYCQPVMVGYGRPDLTLWRDTGVLTFDDLSAARARWMCAQIAKASNRPGGFLMREVSAGFIRQEEYGLD